MLKSRLAPALAVVALSQFPLTAHADFFSSLFDGSLFRGGSDDSSQNQPPQQEQQQPAAPDPQAQQNQQQAPQGLPPFVASNVDLRDANPELGRYFHNPRNQSDLGWCFAYTATDLIAFKTGIQIAPNVLGRDYDVANNQIPIGQMGGWVGDAISLAEKSGACPVSFIPADDPTINALAQCALNLNNGTYDTRLKTFTSKANPTRDFYVPFQGTPIYFCNTDVKTFFPSMGVDGFVRYAQTTSISDISAAKQDLLQLFDNELNCGASRISIPNNLDLGKMVVTTSGIDAVMAQLNYELGEAKTIVAISYDPETIIRPGSDKAQPGAHASSIVARQCSGTTEDTCQYLVRNSWGPDCTDYNTDYQGACIQGEGSYWITDEKLRGVLQQIDWIN